MEYRILGKTGLKISRLGFGQFLVRHEGEDVETVGDGDEHDAPLRELLTVKFLLMAISFLHAAAVDPHHDRHLFVTGLGGCPDVQIQAVLAHGDLRIHMPLSAINICSKSRSVLH